MKYRLYLDNCCFNRPYDDQSYLVIRLETEAKLYIQQEILNETFELVWSYILDFENSVNPYLNRRQAISEWKNIAVLDVDVSEEIVERGKEIMQKGIKKKDALHIASAIQAKCDFFLTTDKKLLNSNFGEITVINPLEFIKILGV
jgi:predicted nucleic acid-binding protein